MRDYKIEDYRIERWNGFKDYYVKMMYYGDCDPSYPCMNYIADRLELNPEQRFWMAFLYGTNYCAPTTYYIMNEFPDFENVDINRMEKWWENNKDKTIFQTDRNRVKSYNLLTTIFKSYKDLVGNSQFDTFSRFLDIENLEERYDALYKFCSNIYYFGRFSLFNYLETLNELTEIKNIPSKLDLKDAESCRNGLCYACGLDNLVTLHHKKTTAKIDYNYLDEMLKKLKRELKDENPEIDVNYFNIETCLCGYKKLFWDTRYLGYYIDRMLKEIIDIEKSVNSGVEWSILRDFRCEFFDHQLLGEIGGWSGIRNYNLSLVSKFGRLSVIDDNLLVYKRKIKFNNIGDMYE